MKHLDEACRIGNGNAGRVNVAQRNGSDRALPGTRQRLRRGAELLGGDWDLQMLHNNFLHKNHHFYFIFHQKCVYL